MSDDSSVGNVLSVITMHVAWPYCERVYLGGQPSVASSCDCLLLHLVVEGGPQSSPPDSGATRSDTQLCIKKHTAFSFAEHV